MSLTTSLPADLSLTSQHPVDKGAVGCGMPATETTAAVARTGPAWEAEELNLTEQVETAKPLCFSPPAAQLGQSL
jgi:hypothetical protein